MSLFSVSNFTAPFKNSTHLILLIMIAGLFGTYRYSGGSIGIKSRTSRPPVDLVTPSQLEEEAVDEAAAEEEDNAKKESDSSIEGKVAPPTKRNILEEMIGKKKKGEAVNDDSKPSLDEIEKKLGLR